MSLSRRGFLAATAFLTATGAASRAMALTIQEADVGTQSLLDNACGKSEQHQQLIAEAEKLLGDRKLTDAEKQRLLAAMNCPICGCPVSGLF